MDVNQIAQAIKYLHDVLKQYEGKDLFMLILRPEQYKTVAYCAELTRYKGNIQSLRRNEIGPLIKMMESISLQDEQIELFSEVG